HQEGGYALVAGGVVGAGEEQYDVGPGAPAPCAGLDEVEKLLPRGVLHGVVALGAELVEVTEVNAFRKAHARHADPVWR
ncbi:hypothetical protein ACWD95_31265, partial [Streptomyces sp. NPDC005069]